jgi:hypothetical protein
VPASTHIVAIGDSQTYGASSPAKDSWPAILQQISKRTVYSLSLGGYGPVEYFHLLTNKALKLSPMIVIVGFYFGNDLLETYETANNNKYWQHLTGVGSAEKDQAQTSFNDAPTFDGSRPAVHTLRRWLGRKSVLYNVIIHSAIGELARAAEARMSAGDALSQSAVLYNKNRISTGFTPEVRLKALDLKDSRVKEGLRRSLDLLSQMNAYCLNHHVRFLVSLIPTKESVYAKYLESDAEVGNRSVLRSLLTNERTVNATTRTFFEERKIAYVDPLPDLQQQAGRMPLYPGNYDGHPNKNGNRIIAEAVARYLRVRRPELTGAVPVAGKQ